LALHVCARGDGIRRSKDLRAEIGKFSNSTNERKKMSKKTIKQRIALVAVSALTAGVFSVVSAPVAYANFAAGEVSFVAAGGVNNLGSCIIDNTTSSTDATFRNGSVVVLEADGVTAADTIAYSISGPGVIQSYTSQPAIVTLAGSTAAVVTSIDSTTVVDGSAVVGDRLSILLTGVGTVTVAIGATATGAVLDTITITSVAACANSAWSSTYSDVSVVSSATDSSWTANVDENTSVSAGGALYIRVDGENAYDADITTGTWAASATNGALVNYGSAVGTAVAVAGSTSFQSSTDADGRFVFRVDPASQAAGGTTVVTITLGGTTIATKSLTFFGEAKSIKVVTNRSGLTSTAVAGDGATGYFTFQFLDAAGTAVPGNGIAFVAASATTNVTTGATVKAPASSAASITDATDGLIDTLETAIGSTKDGVAAFTCGSGGGTSTTTWAHANAVTGDTITVNVPLTCAGGIATYTVSTDKASYAVGDVATITIDAKDSAGRPVADSVAMETGSVSVGGGAVTRAVATTDLFTGGKRTVQAQMTDAGSFNTVVTLTGSVTTSATAKYINTDGAVSNAEVLKSIVALIASINKQIAALQKLILARR